MAVIGHWVAADAGGAGTTLSDRSASAAHGTLTAGCSWGTVGAAEAAVRCPASDSVTVADHARWQFTGDFTLIVRLVYHGLSGQPAWIGQSQGGANPKWAWYQDGGRQLMHWQTAGAVVGGAAWAPTVGAVYALAVKRSGSTFTYYRDGATDGSATEGSAFSDVSGSLHLGWGGEAFWNSDVSIVALRVYDEALADAAIFAAMAEDAGAGPPAVELEGTAALQIDATADLLVIPPGVMTGSAALSITASAALTVSAGTLSGTAALVITASGTLVGTPPILAGTATLAIAATVATLAAPAALLAARTGLRIDAVGALVTSTAARPLRAETIQRPFGRLERV